MRIDQIYGNELTRHLSETIQKEVKMISLKKKSLITSIQVEMGDIELKSSNEEIILYLREKIEMKQNTRSSLAEQLEVRQLRESLDCYSKFNMKAIRKQIYVNFARQDPG